MTASVGITGHGAYVPLRRIGRGEMYDQTGWFAPGLPRVGERSWCGWDEDVLTMSVEASRDCLASFSSPPRIAGLALASTTSPFADRLGAAVVCEALNLAEDAAGLDVGGSRRVGTSALIQALGMSVEPGTDVLCVASEQILSRSAGIEEAGCGDGAAAFAVGTEGVIAECLGWSSRPADFIDHYRAATERFAYSWEPRWVRDEGVGRLVPAVVERALERAGVAPAEVGHFAFPSLVPDGSKAVAKKVGIAAEAISDVLAAGVGVCGAAAPLLELSLILETAAAGEVIVVAGFGSGADAIVLRRTEVSGSCPRTGVSGWLRRRQASNDYLRFLAARGLVELDGGMRSEFDQRQSMSALWRDRRGYSRLQGATDADGGQVVFPPPPGTEEEGTDFHTLSDDVAKIVTYTADRLAYSLDPPVCYGVIDFPSGARMTAEFCDVKPEDLEVEMKVRMMYRIKALDDRRDFRAYFWKATPDYVGVGGGDE